MKILLGPEYVSDEEEPDSEEASEGEQEDARDTFVDRTTVRFLEAYAEGGGGGTVIPSARGLLTTKNELIPFETVHCLIYGVMTRINVQCFCITQTAVLSIGILGV